MRRSSAGFSSAIAAGTTPAIAGDVTYADAARHAYHVVAHRHVLRTDETVALGRTDDLQRGREMRQVGARLGRQPPPLRAVCVGLHGTS